MPLHVLMMYMERLPAMKAEAVLLVNDAISLAFAKEGEKRSEAKRLQRLIEQFQPPVLTKRATPAILRKLGIGVKKG